MTSVLLSNVGIEGNQDVVVDTLVVLGFLGLEIRRFTFEFSEDLSVHARSKALARKVMEESKSSQRFAIHPAFWDYLDTAVNHNELMQNPVFNRT